MPLPKNVRPPPDGFASPVPAHNVPSGPVASAPMAWLASLGQAGRHVIPASVLFHTPPPDTAVYSVSAWVGSTTRSTIRAPTFEGPTTLQEPPAPCGIAAACWIERATWPGDTSRPDVHFRVR